MDADAVIKNFDIDFYDIGIDYKLIMRKNEESRNENSTQMLFTTDCDQPRDTKGNGRSVNMGVFMYRTGEAVDFVMNRLMLSNDPKVIHHRFWEQKALLDHLKTDTTMIQNKVIKVVPWNVMNSIGGYYRKGDFVKHHAGQNDQARDELINDFARESFRFST
eukprot:gene11124-13146_t